MISTVLSICVCTIITASAKGKVCIIENKLANVDIIIPATDPLYDQVRLDEQFAAYRGTLEERDETLHPSIITYPKTQQEIQTMINFASDCNYKIAVRSGGHQYSGLSSCNRLHGKCIQIDMKFFDHVTYNKDDNSDPEKITTITVGAGVKLGDLSPQNAARGVAIIHGVCEGVAAGGHYQSSSQGGWSRSMGLGMDWIYRIKLVTADGKIKNVYKNGDDEDDNDLFWAILGGSPGSWGVIIEYEFIPIYDGDYPYSSIHIFSQEYTEQYFKELFVLELELLDNKYYKMANDMNLYSFIKANRTNQNDISTHRTNYVWTHIPWNGANYGDIYNIIPNHPDNKTWYEELVQPFKDLSEKYHETIIQIIETDITISQYLLFAVADEEATNDVPPYRFYSTYSAYKQDVLDNTIYSNESLKYEWVDAVTYQVEKFTRNKTDNIEALFQLQYLSSGQDKYKITDDIIIHSDPMLNSVSTPLRDITLQFDAWILFGNNKANKAKELAKELKDTLNANQQQYNISSFAYTDRSYKEYQIDQQFEYFFPERLDVFEKLKEIKTRVDCKNIFDGPITIPTNKDCVDRKRAIEEETMTIPTNEDCVDVRY